MAPARATAIWFSMLSVARSLSTAAATMRTRGTSSFRSLTNGKTAPACPIAFWVFRLISLLFLARFHNALAASSRSAALLSCSSAMSGMTAPTQAIATWFSACSDAYIRSMKTARCFSSTLPVRRCSTCPTNAGLSVATLRPVIVSPQCNSSPAWGEAKYAVSLTTAIADGFGTGAALLLMLARSGCNVAGLNNNIDANDVSNNKTAAVANKPGQGTLAMKPMLMF
mmetsp:Transcript_79859/g.200971  ORF Transcript_79859/g.200971 Transcript_79859/m.200971 type:complete len:226 (+) Transcript_79859:609-1286(+)